MKNKTINTVSEMFLSLDKDRPHMHKLHHNVSEGLVYGTDAHIAIIAPESMFDLINIGSVENFPNVKKIMPEDTGTLYKIDVKSAIGIISKLKTRRIDRFEDCKECDGEGEIECACCGHSNDCSKCNGSGKGALIDSRNERDVKENQLLINGCYFDPEYILKLLKVCSFLEEPFMALCGKIGSTHLFNAGLVKMIVRPLYEKYEGSNVVEIEVIF